METEQLYHELYRPQFHFTAPHGWLNDPNGLVFSDGEYHLLYQHNPHGTTWRGGSIAWGHAVSTDLLHWEHLPVALEPDARGGVFSGSAAVDWNNTAGFQSGPTRTLVALYTAGGEHARPPVLWTQCLAYSTDRGRTWHKFDGNPVLPQITHQNRDPKIFWHEPSRRWVMALYVGERERHTIQFHFSPDLKTWRHLSTIEGFYECPDLFECDGRWVLYAADGRYVIGQFDGERFAIDTGKHASDWGANFYAAQTFNDIPPADGRRILIGWMRGGRYPDMPFNQQMTFPCELTLRAFPEGLRLCKWPVREIAALHATTHESPVCEGELFDIEAVIEPGNAIECGFEIRGHQVSYVTGDQEVMFNGSSARLPLRDGRFALRLLVDRTSVEIFGNEGRVTMSACFLPNSNERKLAFYSGGGAARLVSLQVRELRSVWSRTQTINH